MLLNKFTRFQIENAAEIKGGFRYVTESRSAFESKRNKLQAQGKNLSINHVSGHYCIEW